MAQVVLKNLVKTYGPVYAVQDVSLTVNDGEFVALVGPSGCGKTTTLNLVAGLIPMTSGEIMIGDRVVTDLDPKDRDIAMVFQNYALYPNKTVYKNLAFPLQMRQDVGVRHRQESARCRRACWTSRICLSGCRRNCQADSNNVWPWAVPWCAIQPSS